MRDGLIESITAYLTGGGLFNPELANHDAVRNLLIDCRDALRAAAQSGPPREPTREVGWLIEREVGWLIEAVAGGLYWCGGSCGWTPSPNLACRFARAADANAAREWLRLPPVDIRVAEHIWIDVAPQTGGKAAPITKPSQPDHAGTAGPPDHQPAATPLAGRPDAGAAQAATDGPAADPIADLCERLRALHIIDEVGSNNPLGRDAADALERLRAERDNADIRHDIERAQDTNAELATAERAAAIAMRERAAQACESVTCGSGYALHLEGQVTAVRKCAAAVRALEV